MPFKLPVGCSWLLATVWLVLSKLGLELSRAVVLAANQVIGTLVIIVAIAFTNIAGICLGAAVPCELVPCLVVASSLATLRLAIVKVQVRLELGRGALVAAKSGRNAGTGPVPLAPSVTVSGRALSPC